MSETFDLVAWTRMRWFLDVNAIDDPRLTDLARLESLGWVRLTVNGTSYTEISGAKEKDPDKYDRLVERLLEFPEARPPLVFNHSSLDHAVLARGDDQDHIEAVYATVWPDNDREVDAAGGEPKTKNKEGLNRFRDALQVANAIRYTGSGFVTQDTKLLKAFERVASAYNGFLLMTIEDATALSLGAVKAVRSSAATIGKPDPASLPDWPK